jgi:hypothetical protein
MFFHRFIHRVWIRGPIPYDVTLVRAIRSDEKPFRVRDRRALSYA